MDAAGRQQVRTINPFPPEDDMVVWMATNSRSLKIQEIRNNPHVCLCYADRQSATGSVVISGMAVLVDDMEEKEKRKRDYWAEAFPDWRYLVLSRIVPDRLDVLNDKREKLNDPSNWRIPTVDLGNSPMD